MPTSFPRTLALALATLLAAAGCAPDPVYRLRADRTGGATAEEWFQGRHYVTRSGGGLEVSMAYERTARGRHVLRAEVVNRSNAAVTVGPSHFRSWPAEAPLDSLPPAVAAARHAVPATDPEVRLLNLDLEREREEARQRTTGAFALVALVADVAGDLAAAGSRTPAEADEDDREDAERVARLQARRAEDRADLRLLADRRALWAETALRRTTLPPGGDVRGRLFFPLDEEAHHVTLAFEGPGRAPVRFFFRQHAFEP